MALPVPDNEGIKISAKVMLVCDPPDTAMVWDFVLQRRGFGVVIEPALARAAECWPDELPDLFVVDSSAPFHDQIEFCRSLREHSVSPLLLFLPAVNETRILEAYDAGVDECVIRPVSPAIFSAKVRAWLRRAWTIPVDELSNVHSAKLVLDSTLRAVVMEDGHRVRLTSLEFRLLYLLMSRPGYIFSPDKIIESVWGVYGQGDMALLKNLVYRLRRKLQADPEHLPLIQNWPGKGYSFSTE